MQKHVKIVLILKTLRFDEKNIYRSFEDDFVAGVEVQVQRFVENFVRKVANQEFFVVNLNVDTGDGVLAVLYAARLQTSLGDVKRIFYGLFIPENERERILIKSVRKTRGESNFTV